MLFRILNIVLSVIYRVAIFLFCCLQGSLFYFLFNENIIDFSFVLTSNRKLHFFLPEILLYLCKRIDADKWNDQVLCRKSSS